MRSRQRWVFQSFLDSTSVRDVEDGADHTDGHSGLVALDARAVIDDANAPVRTNDAMFNLVDGTLGKRFRDGRVDRYVIGSRYLRKEPRGGGIERARLMTENPEYLVGPAREVLVEVSQRVEIGLPPAEMRNLERPAKERVRGAPSWRAACFGRERIHSHQSYGFLGSLASRV